MYKEAQLDADRACFQLAQLVKEIPSYLGPEKSEYQNSLFIFFNECTKTVAQLKRKIEVSRDDLAKSGRLTEQEAAADLSFLLEREENIRIIDPRDRGESREVLLPLLHGARGIGDSYRAHITQAFQSPYYESLRNDSESIAETFLRLNQMLTMQHEATEILRQDIQALMQNIRNDEKAANLYDLSIDLEPKLLILKQQTQEMEAVIAAYGEKQARFARIIAQQCRCCPHCKTAAEKIRQQKK